MDITQLILDDHHEQRRLFSMLEQIDRSDHQSLRPLWERLATFLEVHAAAEEQVFYPELLRLGKGIDAKHTPEEETKDAIRDHNDIREAIRVVAKHTVGASDWYRAIAKANEANGDHMAEEEREGLADFRRHVDPLRRHELAVAFAVFEAVHITGVKVVDREPDAYINEAR